MTLMSSRLANHSGHAVKLRRLFAVACFALTGCIVTPSHYKPAGFSSVAESDLFLSDYLYYANRLTDDEWKAFYKRFPEYWQDIQKAKSLGYGIDFHPRYVSYAFRWTTLRRQKNWPANISERLKRQTLLPGDDVFMVVHALGPPARIVWNNRAEILVYKPGQAIIMDDGKLVREVTCDGCATTESDETTYLNPMSDVEIIRAAGLAHP